MNEELKGRVLSVHGFLDVLRTQHGLAAREAEAISATLLKRQVHLREPLWWT